VATNEDTDYNTLWFRSSEYSNSTYWPKLEVTYSTDAATKTVYFLKDHLGSIRATVLDSAGAPVIGYDDYDPWGYPLATRTKAIPNAYLQGASKIKFAGKERDDEFGINLDYSGARSYDWLTGRWISVDPLAQKYAGWSPYQYSLNNPVKFVDPNGDTVRVYSEVLQPNSLGGGVRGYITSLFRPRHSFIRITTDKNDVTLELGGPGEGQRTGRLLKGSFNNQQRPGQEEHEVTRPEDIVEGNAAFENTVLEAFEFLGENLPDYNALNTNSNGFVRFLIEQTNGNVDLPVTAYGKDEIQAYRRAYHEALRRREEQERKRREEQERQKREEQKQ